MYERGAYKIRPSRLYTNRYRVSQTGKTSFDKRCAQQFGKRDNNCDDIREQCEWRRDECYCSFLISRNIAIYLRKLIKVASRLIKFHLIGQRRATYAVTRIFQMQFAQNLMDQLTSHATLLNYGEFFS